MSSHHKLADALNVLRNKAGPASHGKDPYLERLAEYHRRGAVLAADAIVAFLHKAYLDAQLDPINSREPWERFRADNVLIDAHVGLAVTLRTATPRPYASCCRAAMSCPSTSR